MEFKKEMLNRNRVLTMSTNRKGDYLTIYSDYQTKLNNVMIIRSYSGDVNDVIFIKQIPYESIDKIFDICFEFNISNILIDINGFGSAVANNILEYIKSHKSRNHIDMIQVRDGIINKSSELSYIYQDIENGKLRFLQSVNCAKINYRKAFLGYSEIIDCHRETDKLIDEMSDIKLSVNYSGILKLNNNIECSRLNCLMIYYSTYDSLDNMAQKDNK